MQSKENVIEAKAILERVSELKKDAKKRNVAQNELSLLELKESGAIFMAHTAGVDEESIARITNRNLNEILYVVKLLA